MNMWQWILDGYQKLRYSIAFRPAVITWVFALMAGLMVSIEGQGIDAWLAAHFEPLTIRDNDTARLILGTLVGGMISMMVFSFTMVMTTLSRASATLSPRVIPGIVSKRSHQITLGVNLGTILFALVLATRVAHDGVNDTPPSAGVLMAIVLALVNLVFFVAFIESISRDIHVDRVCEGIYQETRSQLIEAIKKVDIIRQPLPIGSASWPAQKADTSGYLLAINRQRLAEIASKHDLTLHLMKGHGTFILRGEAIIKAPTPLVDTLWQAIRACLIIDTDYGREQHFSVGLRKLSEIAIKALSPGINDPGTAIYCLDLLSDLLPLLCKIRPPHAVLDSNGVTRLWVEEQPLKDYLRDLLMPIYHYGCSDAHLVRRMHDAIKRAADSAEDPSELLWIMSQLTEPV